MVFSGIESDIQIAITNAPGLTLEELRVQRF